MKWLIAFAVIAVLLFGCAQSPPPLGKIGSAHEHADFKVYIDGAAYDFSQAKYQTPIPPGGDDSLCANGTTLAHIHDGDGDVIHKHATGVTWGYFFSTLGMRLTDQCLQLDNGTSYCNGDEGRWRYFINGSEKASLTNVEIHNLDRALFTYGADSSQIAAQIASVTNKAALEPVGAFC